MFVSILVLDLVLVGDCSRMEEYVMRQKTSKQNKKWSTPLLDLRMLFQPQIDPLAFEWTPCPSVQSSKRGTTGRWDAGIFLKLATRELVACQLSINLLLGKLCSIWIQTVISVMYLYIYILCYIQYIAVYFETNEYSLVLIYPHLHDTRNFTDHSGWPEKELDPLGACFRVCTKTLQDPCSKTWFRPFIYVHVMLLQWSVLLIFMIFRMQSEVQEKHPQSVHNMDPNPAKVSRVNL